MDAFATPRPALRPLDATTTLADVAIVTFVVDPDALARLLPDGLEPEVVTLDGGERRGLVSAVPFRDVDFRFGAAPWLRSAFRQANYRAYVVVDGARAVWFFGTTLDSPLVAVPRHAWRMPWHRARTSLRATWSGRRCDGYELVTTGRWGAARASLVGTHEPLARLDGFASGDETALVLTHPLRGYFRRRDGAIGMYEVWHDRLRPTVGRADVARFDALESTGLVAPGARPHSVLLEREIEFVIRLPPRRVGLVVAGP